MIRKGVFFFLLFFLINLPLRIEAQDLLELDLLTAIQLAIEHNQELDLVRREEQLMKKKEAQKKQAFQITFSTDPKITMTGEEVIPTFTPTLKILAQRDFLGGTLSGNLVTAKDMLYDGELESIISISYRIPLFGAKEEEIKKINLYQQQIEGLVEEVMRSYHALLLKEREISLLEKRLDLMKLKLKAALYTGEESLLKEAQEQVIQVEETLDESRSTYEGYQRSLLQLLNPPQRETILLQDLVQLRELDPLDHWLQKALLLNPSIIKAKENLEKLDGEEGFLASKGWSVNLSTGLEPYQISPKPMDPSYFIMVQIGHTFSSSSSLKREEDQLKLDRSILELQRAKEMVEDLVTNRFQHLLKTLGELEEKKRELEKSQDHLSMIETKYSLGLIGPVERKESLVNHLQLEYSLLTTTSTSLLGYMELKKACGLTIVPEEVMNHENR